MTHRQTDGHTTARKQAIQSSCSASKIGGLQ